MTSKLTGLQFNGDVSNAGLVLRNLTTTERDAIIGPLEGSTIANETTNRQNYYDGTAWQQIAYTSDIVVATGPFATVAPSGADYTTIEAAATAGERNIAVTGDVTETVDFTLPVGESMKVTVLPDVTVTYTNVTPYTVGSNSTLVVSGGTHVSNRTTSPLVDASTATNTAVILEKVRINDSGSAAATTFPIVANSLVTSNLNVIINESEIDFADGTDCGLSGNGVTVFNSILRGGGASATNLLSGTNFRIWNSIIEGTLSTVSDGFTVTDSEFMQVNFAALAGMLMTSDNLLMQKCRIIGPGSTLTITASNEVDIQNSNLSGVDITFTSNTKMSLWKSTINSFDDSALGSSFNNQHRITESTVVANTTLGSGSGRDGFYIVNSSTFDGNLTVNTNGTGFVTLISNHIGTPTGSETFIINAGAEKVVAAFNRSATALVDNSGTGTSELVANNTL